MTDFFSTDERISQFLEEAESWKGTPFRKYCQVKGEKGGIDCIRLIGQVLANTGAIPPVDWSRIPNYSLDWSSHHDAPILEDAIRDFDFKYRRIEPGEDLMIGDVLAFAPGKVVYHLGLYCGRQRILHALRNRPVDYEPTSNQTLARFYRYAMRPIEREE